MGDKVIFVKDRETAEIVAVFPEVIHNKVSRDVVMYTHSEGHTCGMMEWAKEQDKPFYDEIVPLFRELNSIVHNNLQLTTI